MSSFDRITFLEDPNRVNQRLVFSLPKALVVQRSAVDNEFHCSLCGNYSTESALVCSLHIQHTCAYALGVGRFVLKERDSSMVWERKVEGVRFRTIVGGGGVGSSSSSSSVQ